MVKVKLSGSAEALRGVTGQTRRSFTASGITFSRSGLDHETVSHHATAHTLGLTHTKVGKVNLFTIEIGIGQGIGPAVGRDEADRDDAVRPLSALDAHHVTCQRIGLVKGEAPPVIRGALNIHLAIGADTKGANLLIIIHRHDGITGCSIVVKEAQGIMETVTGFYVAVRAVV